MTTLEPGAAAPAVEGGMACPGTAAPAPALAADPGGAAPLGLQLRALYLRELSGFFLSPVSYLVWMVFLVAAGYLFATSVRTGAPASLDGTLVSMGMLLLFVTPLLTMRLVAEEHRLGTLEVLLTDPVSDGGVILSKFLASVSFLAVMLAPTAAFPAILAAVGEPDPGPIAAGYLGLLLLGGLYLSVGLLASSLLDSQIAAAASSFTLLLVLWLLGRAVGGLGPSGFRDGLEYLSTFHRFEPFRRGLLDTRTLVFCLSATGLALFLAVRALGLRRLR